MLSRADSALAARDPQVPALSLLFDAERFGQVLREHGVVGRDAKVQLDYLRYKPATNCTARYQVSSRDHAPTVVYAKALQNTLPDAGKLADMSLQPTTRGVLGFGRLLLPKLTIAVTEFPNDNKLPQLTALFDPAQQLALLASLGIKVSSRDSIQLEVLAYKPERRATVKLVLPERTIVLKAYSMDEWPKAKAANNAVQSSNSVLLPTCIGMLEGERLLAFRWQNGESLRAWWRDSVTARAGASLTGGALARIHAIAADTWPLDGLDCFAQRIEQLIGQLEVLAPRAAGAARRLAAQALPLLDSARVAAAHGDFYDKQVLIADRTAQCIDFDSASRANPALDLGNFIAHLERDLLARRLPAPTVKAAISGLLAGYAHGGGTIEHNAVAGATALALIQLCHHPFRYREAEWPSRILAIVERAQSILDRSVLT
jgi:hypothetical protein